MLITSNFSEYNLSILFNFDTLNGYLLMKMHHLEEGEVKDILHKVQTAVK